MKRSPAFSSLLTATLTAATSVCVASGIIVACANGSSLGIETGSDASTNLDPGQPTEISQPVPTHRDASSLGMLPLGDAGEAGAAQGTMTLDGGGDGGNGCAAIGPSFVCGLNPQCGCASGQTCDISNDTTGATACVDAGSSIQGDECFVTSDCQAGLTCFLGACRPYCTGDTVGGPCTGTGLGTCAQASAGDQNIPNEEVCYVSCDLANPAAACGANGCVHAGGQTNCETVGFAVSDEDCDDPTDCAPGYACVTFTTSGSDASSSTCQAYCTFPTGTCSVGQTCQHFSTDIVLNGKTYGFCQ
jgi:hypothetical protein